MTHEDAPAQPAPSDLPRSFETALAALESTVRALESGELPLEKALSTFEEGVKLSQHCKQLLDTAEMKVNLLQEKDGEPTLEPFEAPND